MLASSSIEGFDCGRVVFVVVDDTAGADVQIDELSSLDDVRVLEPPFNLGHQRAIVYAVRTLARSCPPADVFVTLDADGEDRPEDLPRLLTVLFAGSADPARVVLAERTKRSESLAFKVLYLAFRFAFRLLTGTTIRTGNYAAFRGQTAQRVFSHPALDLSYSSALLSVDVPRVFVGCERGRRYAGESRMGFSKLSIHALRMLMPFIDRIATRALVVFVATLALAVAITCVVLGVSLLTDSTIPGWAAYTLSTLALISLVSFGSFVTLFVVFSQSRAVSLSDLEERADG